jgi:hypothetical protein
MRSRLLLMIPALTIPLALAFGGACAPSKRVSDGGAANPPAIFVIDSTGTLISFDAKGNKLGSAPLPAPIGDINGGGIAYASGNLYVTIGQPTNSVVSFTTGLAPIALPTGAFAGLSVPRGIVYDAPHSFFFVGNGAATVNVYDPNGAVVQDGLFPNHYGPSGVAYDPDDDFTWVANYVGTSVTGTPQFGVQDYEFNGSAAHVHDYSKQFVGPAHTEPYSVAVCPHAATGGDTIVEVGFIDDGSGQGTANLHSFLTSGAPLGNAPQQPVTKPYAISCDPQAQIYVADASGLYIGHVGGSVRPAAQYVGNPGAFAVTPPVYGVLAIAAAGGGGGDDGGSDAPVTEDGGSDGFGGDGGSCPAPDGGPQDFGTGFTFQPSNVCLGTIQSYVASAQDETLSGTCSVETSLTMTGGGACFMSPFEIATETDPVSGTTSTINLIVVKSLSMSGATQLTVTGAVPLVIVSLGDVSLSNGASIVANSQGTGSTPGAGGGLGGQPGDNPGNGPGGGAASPDTTTVGSGGGSFCGLGGPGPSPSMIYGAPDLRPLVGGSGAGGASGTGAGNGGGAIQIAAAGTIAIGSGSYVSVSGGGGVLGGGLGGGCTFDNGTGGGSGGAILLEAPSVTVAGALVANGGGGGAAQNGQDGWYQGPLSSASTPTAGGTQNNGMYTGTGGLGGAGTTPNGTAGVTGSADCGTNNTIGGGGGGGAGRIRINSSTGTATLTGGTLSPSDPTCATQKTVRPLGSTP